MTPGGFAEENSLRNVNWAAVGDRIRPSQHNYFGVGMYKLLALLLVGLVGCGTVSDVVSIDSETYMVGSHGVLGNGSSAAEKAKAIQAASAFCQKQLKVVQVVQIESVDPFFGRAPSADVRFHCVPK